MIIKKIIYFLLLNFSFNLLARETDCLHLTGLAKKTTLENFATDCNTASILANDEQVRQDHQKKIHEKLALSLARQIQQNSEELSLLTSFFAENKQNLMMNSQEIANSCRLEAIKKIETCNGKNTSPHLSEKIAMIKKNFPSNANTPFRDDSSLYGKMAGKFYSDLGIVTKDQASQCPLNNSSSDFFLLAQLNNNSTKDIVKNVNAGEIQIKELYNRYPQLKMIKNTNDPVFIGHFINYIKQMPHNSNPKDYIAAFLFNPENQKKLAPSIASQCERINQNLNSFLCSDLEELGTLNEDISTTLFDGLSTTEPLADQFLVEHTTIDPSTKSETPSMAYVAYGMQCTLRKRESSSSGKISPHHKNAQSLDAWYNAFTKNTRPENQNKNFEKKRVQDFCAYYTCQDPKVLPQKSCKAGGPISSSDLAEALGCNQNPVSESCNSFASQSISYLESLEKINTPSINSVAKQINPTDPTNTISVTNDENSARLPDFAKNYLGVTGSLIALGKPVTSQSIAKKQEDFEKSGLSIAPPAYTSPLEANRAPSNKISPLPSNALASVSNGGATTSNGSATAQTVTSSIQPPQQATIFAPSPSTSQAPPPTTLSPTKNSTAASANKILPSDSSDSDRTKEIAKIREELERIMAQKSSIEQENVKKSAEPESDQYIKRMAKIKSYNIEEERLRSRERELMNRGRNNYNESHDTSNLGNQHANNPSEHSNQESNATAESPGHSGAGANGSGAGKINLNGSAARGLSTANENNLSSNGQSPESVKLGKNDIVFSPDQLSNLSSEKLEMYGVDPTKPFILNVKFNDKIYQIVVKKFNLNGKILLGPLLNFKPREDFKKLIIDLPLFKPYFAAKSSASKENNEK